MRRRLTWLLVTLGIAALVRRLRRSKPSEHSPAEPAGEDDPAVELRRKLDEARVADEPAAEPSEGSVEDRRAEVHEQGRTTLAEMQDPDR